MSKNDKIELLSASQKAYDTIRDRILDGTLKPGTRLSKRKMAALAGVSVIPVIEALHRIENDGLAYSKSQWGAFVTVPTRQEVLNRYALREAVECQAARILAETLSEDDEERLCRLARKLDASRAGEGTKRQMWALHHEFHLAMVDAAGFSSLSEALQRCNLFSLLVRAVVAQGRRAELPPDWHQSLIDAIAARDPDKAEARMRLHVRNGLDGVLEDLKQALGETEGRSECAGTE
jgi:GntR family transcriptional regulator, rspAB operon transcriptional repressor